MVIVSCTRNRRGIALLYLVVLFTLLGVLVSTGLRMFGSRVTLGKTKDTKAELERDVQIITAWAVKNGHWPAFAHYTAAIFGSRPRDAWGKPIVYAYYSSPSHSSINELCGRTTSDITYNSQPVAFLLRSGFTTDSDPIKNGAFTGELTGKVKAEDLYRIVTLKELQTQAGCDGSTQGSLRILNNELPVACKPQAYKTTLFADGGVPPVSFSYPDRPSWLSPIRATFATLSGNTGSAALGPFTISVTATDSAANVVKRSYNVTVNPCN